MSTPALGVDLASVMLEAVKKAEIDERLTINGVKTNVSGFLLLADVTVGGERLWLDFGHQGQELLTNATKDEKLSRHALVRQE